MISRKHILLTFLILSIAGHKTFAQQLSIADALEHSYLDWQKKAVVAHLAPKSSVINFYGFQSKPLKKTAPLQGPQWLLELQDPFKMYVEKVEEKDTITTFTYRSNFDKAVFITGLSTMGCMTKYQDFKKHEVVWHQPKLTIQIAISNNEVVIDQVEIGGQVHRIDQHQVSKSFVKNLETIVHKSINGVCAKNDFN